MIDTGVAHGRFQIFHNDHLKYLQAAKARCRHLVVAITNPDPTLTRFDPADPGRSSPGRNPLSYYERYRIINKGSPGAGLGPGKIFPSCLCPSIFLICTSITSR